MFSMLWLLNKIILQHFWSEEQLVCQCACRLLIEPLLIETVEFNFTFVDLFLSCFKWISIVAFWECCFSSQPGFSFSSIFGFGQKGTLCVFVCVNARTAIINAPTIRQYLQVPRFDIWSTFCCKIDIHCHVFWNTWDPPSYGFLPTPWLTFIGDVTHLENDRVVVVW
jgi:hypothetical protein